MPIITLAGRHAIARAGVAILNKVDLGALVADTPERYVQIAADLAGDLKTLAELRAGLRQRMQTSVLCDAEGFARDVEAKYRWMWRQWCEGRLSEK